MGVLLTDSDPKRAENEYTVPQKEKSPDPGYFNLNYENQRNEEMQQQPQGFQVGYADEKKHVNPIWKMLILLFGVVSCVALMVSIYMVHSALDLKRTRDNERGAIDTLILLGGGNIGGADHTDIQWYPQSAAQTLAGPPGFPGSPGPRGTPGPRGPAGPAGPPGNLDVLAVNGVIQGPPGPSGPIGATGKRGFPGYPGAPGYEGRTGATGSAGVAGPPGYTGYTGGTGHTGPLGPL